MFHTGQGLAYDAWRDWDSDAGGVSLALVRATVLATNAQHTQPWLVRAGSDRIDLHAAQDRNIGTIDSLRREMYMSLDCAPENLAPTRDCSFTSVRDSARHTTGPCIRLRWWCQTR